MTESQPTDPPRRGATPPSVPPRLTQDPTDAVAGNAAAATVADVLPLGLVVRGRRVVVVGAGTVALRRVMALLAVGADVHVVAPEATPALAELAVGGAVAWLPRAFAADDLAGAWLVAACTNDPLVNEAVVAAANERQLFCSRADDGRRGSAWNPAVGRVGAVTVAVQAGRDPGRAVAIRDLLMTTVEAAAIPAVRTGSGLGRVILVGGGPGDPGLITVRGRAALAEADVVIADRLAPLVLLDELGSDVVIVDAAKVPGGPSLPQDEINRLLIEHSVAGRVVVRLKGGDPFVFGRGGEEVEACLAAGLAVEVVPGVTSAISVPALAGIPVTHRGLTQGFTVVSGHLAPGHPDSTLDWPALARLGGTLVILMGLKSIPAICSVLLESGLAADTPVAALQDGATATARTLRTTLGSLTAELVTAGLRTPTIFVVGAVAALGA